MKILEAQSATLTNYEVYQFLQTQSKEYHESKRRGPGNLETLRRELLQYLETKPGPLHQQPLTYTPESIPTLLQRLQPYDIAKGEMLMILNLRPNNVPTLNTILEDMELRFTDDQQTDIVTIITEVLGQFPPAEDEAEGDAMETTENGS